LHLAADISHAAHAPDSVEHFVQLVAQDVPAQSDVAVVRHHIDRFCVFDMMTKLGTYSLFELVICWSILQPTARLGGGASDAVADVLTAVMNLATTAPKQLYRFVTHERSPPRSTIRVQNEHQRCAESEPQHKGKSICSPCPDFRFHL
jgi:hypothetical protein